MDEPSPSYIDYDVEETQFDDGDLKYICIPHWVDAFQSKDVHDYRVLLEIFVEQFLNVGGFTPSISRIFMTVLQSYGVRIYCETKCSVERVDQIQIKTTGKCGSFVEMMRKISDIMKDLNTAVFLRKVLMIGGVDPFALSLSFTFDRLDMWYLTNIGYLKGLELKLSSVNLLRRLRSNKKSGEYRNMNLSSEFRHKSISTFMVHFTMSALQTVLMNYSSNLDFVGDQIIQLAHSHVVKMRNLTFDSDLLGHLNEMFICCLAHDLKFAQEELSNMEGIIRKKSSKFFIPWNAWNIVSRYERNIDISNPSAFLIDATRLADSISDEEISPQSVVFVEEACKIWKNCKTYDHEIIQVINDYTKKHPQNGPRMLELAKFCEVEYEIDSLIEDMCCHETDKLHPSDKVWLEWIERRLNRINRFGDIETSVKQCLTAIFNFLDYDSNKCSQKAWELLHKVVQMARPIMVAEEWISRNTWWPRFHRNSYDFALKTEVLNALEQLNIS